MAEINSMTEVAYTILTKKKNAMAFSKLYEQVASKLAFDEPRRKAKISQFYTDLSLDKRFTALKENKWQLASRIRFEERYVNVDELLLEDEEEQNVLMSPDSEDIYKKDDLDEDDNI